MPERHGTPPSGITADCQCLRQSQLSARPFCAVLQRPCWICEALVAPGRAAGRGIAIAFSRKRHSGRREGPSNMKVGIVGCGMVGSASAYALVMRGVGREIVLVDLNRARAEAEANDIFHAVPFAHPLMVRAGAYDDLVGARVVVIAGGVGQKPGETRLQLLKRNAEVFHQIVPSVLRAAPDAVLLIVTNPVDIMTHLAADYAAALGVPNARVLGSGTTLDTARFRVLLGRHFGVDPRHVHAYVVGEHGDSEVLAWSQATIAGLHLDQFAAVQGRPLDGADRQQIDRNVREAAYQIIAGKGASYYGIGSAVAHIVDVLLNDRRAVLTICARIAGVPDCDGLTLALPHLVGGDGALATIPLDLTTGERDELRRSAGILREAIASLHAT
jgi:L-lactate dehydrogenase